MRWQLTQDDIGKLETLSVVSFLPRKDTAQMLGTHPITVIRYAKTLGNAIAEFGYTKGEGGYTGEAVQIMLLYRNLTSKGMSRLRAIKTISLELMAHDSISDLAKHLTQNSQENPTNEL